MMQDAIADRITGVSAPVLVLRGAQDPVVTEKWCALLAGLAPAGQFHGVPGKGHVVQHGAARETARMIQAFTAHPAQRCHARGPSPFTQATATPWW